MPNRNDELWNSFNAAFFTDLDEGDMLFETPPAFELTPDVANHRQILNILLMIDVSGSMRGQRIAMVNNALENIVKELRKWDDLNAVIRLGVMEFADDAQWLTPQTVPVHEYVFTPIQAQPWLTNYGPAFRQLNAKLNGEGFMDRSLGEFFSPLILFVSDGEPTDVGEYPAALDALRANGWFKHAAKYAIAVGEEARTAEVIGLLSQFTGIEANVRYADEGEALCSLIEFVAIEGSKVQSSMVSSPEEADSLSSIFMSRDESLFTDL